MKKSCSHAIDRTTPLPALRNAALSGPPALAEPFLGLRWVVSPHVAGVCREVGSTSGEPLGGDFLALLELKDLHVGFGKEWWVSPNWALGVGLELMGAYLPDGERNTPWRLGGGVVQFSATYN